MQRLKWKQEKRDLSLARFEKMKNPHENCYPMIKTKTKLQP